MTAPADSVSGNEAQGVELKACPAGHTDVNLYADRFESSIFCGECTWRIEAATKADAIAAWNDRPAPSYPPHVEALLAAAKALRATGTVAVSQYDELRAAVLVAALEYAYAV